ncbi:MAG: hypothetical protein IPM42_12325 [Saprospiraceae bacterium]|nr:hypothetical protein [Saprospiraceae bacterium]
MKFSVLTILFFFIADLTYGQVFNAASDSSDYYIDVDWTLPVDPCLLDGNGYRYNELTTQLLKNGQQIDFTTYTAADLLSIYGPNEPIINYVLKINNDFISTNFGSDPFIQNMNDYTVEMWFKPHNGSEDLYRIQPNIKVRIENYNKIFIGPNSINYSFVPNSWCHIAMVANQSSGNTQVFVNGSSVGTINSFHPAKDIQSIGDFFKQNFLLGEFRLWNVKRTPFQILQSLGSVSTLSTNLVTIFKYSFSTNTFVDLAFSTDGLAQNLSYANNSHTIEPFTYIPPYKPITGTLRDYVGPNQNHNYAMLVYDAYGIPAGSCSPLTDAGSTLPVRAPQQMSVSTNLLDRVTMTWKNKSDLATSFRVYRDGILIHTIISNIGKDSTFTFHDVFSATNPLSIQSGKTYTYTLQMSSSHVNQSWDYTFGIGKTLSVDFLTSDNFDDRVTMSWLPASGNLIDKYQIFRKNKLFSVRQNNETSFVDVRPHFGDSILYELKLIKNDSIKAIFKDKGFVAPNGSLSGRVVTKNDFFPVANVMVKVKRLSNGKIDSLLTNASGVFDFTGLSYGIVDSFELSASKSGHGFTYPTRVITLTAGNFAYNDAIILDSFEYVNGSANNTVNLFTATADTTQDQVLLEWELASNAPSVFVDIIRNGKIIFNEVVTSANFPAGLQSSYLDKEGIPNEKTKYEVRIYNIQGNAVSAASKDSTLFFPDVSKIPLGDLSVAPETVSSNLTGNVSITWSHTSTNIDGFRLYRNDSLIVELPDSIFAYIDKTAPFNVNLFYKITAIRKINNRTYETKIPTNTNPAFINLGPMPKPAAINFLFFSNDPSIRVSWDEPVNLNNNTNYTGYIIYRNDEEIARRHKSLPSYINDYEGFGLTNIVYKVSLYRAMESGEIESDKTSSASVNFPVLTAVHDNFSATPNNTNGTIHLTWDIGIGQGFNINGILLIDNDVEIARLSLITTQFIHLPNTSGVHNYKLYLYSLYEGVEYLSSSFASTTANITIAPGTLYAPQNFMASRDLPNHVKLCWEYLDFIQSEFEIYRNEVLIAVLPVGSRSYYDYTADPFDHSIRYRVRAKLQGVFSKYVGASADIIGYKMVFGTVINSNTGLGIKNVSIWLNLYAQNLYAITNEAGYYSFLVPNEYLNTILIATVIGSGSGVRNIIFGEADHYREDFIFEFPEEFPYTSNAVIKYLDVDIDIYDLTGNIHWQPTNSNYDGVEVRRGVDIIATLDKSEGNMCVDSTAVPGIEYLYQIRTYIDDPEKGRIFTDYDENVNKRIEYPPLSPVINLTATPLINENAVKIQWSHLYDHADGYEITRNGIFIKQILKDNPYTFTDTTGTAAQQYTYTLRAYKIINNEIYFSTEENVTVIYPSAAKVKNFVLTSPSLFNTVSLGSAVIPPIKLLYYFNHVLLTWEYDGAALEGFKIYRNDELIAVLPADSTSYKDYAGTPETDETYSIEAIIKQNGVINTSAKVNNGITFPKLEQPYDMSVTPRPAIGDVEVRWKYLSPGIDGFKIVNAQYDTVVIDKDIIISSSIFSVHIDKATYPGPSAFYKIYAFSKRNGVEYLSSVTQINDVNYPEPPPVTCSASDGTYDNAVEITWTYPLDANIDSFQISRFGPGLILTSVATVSKGQRKYVEDFININPQGNYNYFIRPVRIVNGSNVAYNLWTLDEGWPGKGALNATAPITSILDNGGVSVDKEWMVIGKPGENGFGTTHIYKHENSTWIEKQSFQAVSPVNFGFSTDISDSLLVVGALTLPPKGAFNVYKLDANSVWNFFTFYAGHTNDNSLGKDVAISNNRIAVMGSYQFWTPSQNVFKNSLRVFEIPPGCNSSFCVLEIPVDSIYLTGMENWTVDRAESIDIVGEDIFIGFPNATNTSIGVTTGLVAHYKIEGGMVRLKHIIPGNASFPDLFGWDVEMANGVLAIGSVYGAAPNGIHGGKVTLYRFGPINNNPSAWYAFQTLYPDVPVHHGFFGRTIKMNGNNLAISEYNRPNNGSNFYLFQKDPYSDLFEILQSPNPGNSNYRSAFFDSGSPDIYQTGFGNKFDLSDNHLAIGSISNVYPFDLFPVKIINFTASDGTFNDTKLSWNIDDCLGCPADYIDSIRVYRDGSLIARLPGTATSFFDNAGNLLPGVPEAVSGKEYIYEIAAKINADFEYATPKSFDTGYSKRKGKFSGQVLVFGTSSPVPGVTINLMGVDSTDYTTYEYTTTTLSDGTFIINDIYVGGGNGIIYIAEASYQDHEIIATGGDTYLFTPNAFEKTNVLFFDQTAYLVTGRIYRQGSLCNLENIIVNYYQSINGVESFMDSTRTDVNGFYSIVVMPTLNNLTQIRISVDNLQENQEEGDTSYVQYQFSPSSKIYNNFINFAIVNKQDFVDTLTYSITLSVENTCGNAIANQPILIRIGDLDGCYEYEVQTDDFGYINLDLPPKNYIMAVTGIVGSGVTNYENAGVDFLKARPVFLNLLDIHQAAGDDTLPYIAPVKFVYHRAVSFAYTTSFDRFLCNDTQQPAIIRQGDGHSIDFILSENHRPGESCEVSEGYLIIRNSGAQNAIETIYSQNGNFPTYVFRGGQPNLVPPHVFAISIQYFSDQGSLLGEKIIPIIVEGQRQLPGTGVITDALTDDGGDLLMPLLVLRDPPGDGSYSSIQSGTTINKSLVFDSESSGSLGFFLDGAAAGGGIGGFATLDVGVGGGNTDNYSADFSFTTSQTFATSDSEDAVGRDANIIVGAGVSSLYGLSQSLTFENNCIPKKEEKVTFGIGGFNTTFGYTVRFIENLIQEYKSDSIEVEMDVITLSRPDGSIYTKDEARLYFASKIESWQQMLHYHDVETVPHYVLCNDFSYRDSLSASAIALYDQWRNGFCNMIGHYEGESFVMDESIEWTPAIVAAYNNTIAFTDEIKGYYLNPIDDGDLGLSNKEITANNLSVTNQYHNTLGNLAKSAEVFDFSGGVNFDRTVTTQQSSSTSKSFSRFFYLDAAFGFYVNKKLSFGIAVIKNVIDIEAKIGARIRTNASISISKSQAESNEATISYHIYDDDPEDQIAFIALQAPLQDQTPFFIRLGGLSSCPQEEALTVNQDNAPLLIDDPEMSVIIDPVSGASTANPPPVYDVAIGNAAIFQVKLSQVNGPTNLTRDATVFLDLVSNPNGAIIKIGGSDLNIVSPTFSLPATGSILQSLTVERPLGTPFYNFSGLRIGIRPACGGEAKYITLDVHFASPCSNVSITKPFDGLVVRRINPNIPNNREVIPIEIRDYQSANQNLAHIQLQYKRIGAGLDWQNVPGGLINRQTLFISDAGLANGQDPLYLYEWDITGNYNLYPDGDYRIRALAFCGVNGVEYSNESQITLARSSLLVTGYPEPADGIWTPGDEISVSYSTDIDCGILNVTDSIQNYVTLMDLTTMMPVAFTHICQNNKLTLIPVGPMSLYDGHELRATYNNIKNIVGNIAQNVIWDFNVVTQQVDWAEDVINVTIYENEIKTIHTALFNTAGMIVNGLTLSGNQPWLSANPAFGSTFGVPVNGSNVAFTFDGNNLVAGNYTTTVTVNGMMGRSPSLIVNVQVIKPIPTYPIDPSFTDSMTLVANWSFLNPYNPSTDLNDIIQVYKDGQFRGQGQLQNQGSFYFANIKIFGNASDEGELLDFVIWNSDEGIAYQPVFNSTWLPIPFQGGPGSARGQLSNPEILRVDNDIYQFRRKIFVDSMNVNGIKDGLSWATAFNKLEDGIAIANASDTIWIAKGTYYPSVGDRNASYIVDKSIAILGGFQNGMTSPSQRTGNDETKLSGNIGIKTTNSDNSYHVMETSGTGILLDRITIRDGMADGLTDNNDSGSCLYNTGTITLTNCIMDKGAATVRGTLMYNSGNISINGGVFYIPTGGTISNIYNSNGATITISQNVSILKN